MSIIKFENVSKTYRGDFWKKHSPAVSDLSFEIEANSVTGFIGPNGAGKTTSIKMLLGLIFPSKGKCFLNGIQSDQIKSRNGLGFVSEQPYFYRHLSVRESLLFSYKLKKFDVKKAESEIERVLHKVELNGVENKKLFNLSKGMQQRVNMAQALLGDPDILIFDEPMSGLDPLGRSLFRSIFRELGQKEKTVFFSTHILEDIESICDNIVVLSKGKKEYAGSMDELLAQGTLGTDIILREIKSEERASLLNMNCRLEEHKDGVQIFVPKDEDCNKVLEHCFNKKMIPVTVNKRTSSLEAILYDKEEGLVK